MAVDRCFMTRNQAYVQAYRGFESLPLRQKQETPRLGRFLFLKGTLGKNPLGSTNSPGANSDSRRLAPERRARRGEAHGWAEQSLPLRQKQGTPRMGRFLFPGDDVG